MSCLKSRVSRIGQISEEVGILIAVRLKIKQCLCLSLPDFFRVIHDFLNGMPAYRAEKLQKIPKLALYPVLQGYCITDSFSLSSKSFAALSAMVNLQSIVYRAEHQPLHPYHKHLRQHMPLLSHPSARRRIMIFILSANLLSQWLQLSFSWNQKQGLENH